MLEFGIKMVESRDNNENLKHIKIKQLSKHNHKIIKLLRRADFLAIRLDLGIRVKGLNLQARKRSNEELLSIKNEIRVGFTCSRKVGNAVQRNSAKRRLRHLARECLPTVGKKGWDYNFIGHRKHTETMNFDDLKKSFINAVKQIHRFESQK